MQNDKHLEGKRMCHRPYTARFPRDRLWYRLQVLTTVEERGWEAFFAEKSEENLPHSLVFMPVFLVIRQGVLVRVRER